MSFNSGLYRIHSAASSQNATEALRPYLTEGRSDAVAFAFDWLGRNFVVSPRSWSDANPLILLVDFGEGNVFEIPASVREFHEVELVEYADEALAVEWFADWRASHGGRSLGFG